MTSEARDEIEAGDRFAFGDNWRDFLATVDDDKIEASCQALAEFLGVKDLVGKTFIDVGSGSGLSSLAARRLGAEVTSFDFDPASVGCTRELRRRYDSEEHWRVEHGSALDRTFLASLGTFDVVYSWGVLHHTGDQWDALDAVTMLVAPGGLLHLALYNDQGRMSQIWTRVKREYNAAGPTKRRAIVLAADAYMRSREMPGRVVNRIAGIPTPPRRDRGMDRQRDLVDWVGGYPFEVSTPAEVFKFYRDRGFRLENLKTVRAGLSCNEFLFSRP